MKRDDGGSAFPSHGTMGEVVEPGMALRDWLAAAALAGMIREVRLDMEGAVEEAARLSYSAADAMLRERSK